MHTCECFDLLGVDRAHLSNNNGEDKDNNRDRDDRKERPKSSGDGDPDGHDTRSGTQRTHGGEGRTTRCGLRGMGGESLHDAVWIACDAVLR